MLRVNALTGFGARAKPIAATITAENTNATSSATQTHSGLSFGAAFGSRVLLVVVSFDGPNNTLATTGCTVDGNAATLVVEQNWGSGSDAAGCAIYAIEDASATSGDVVVSFSAVSRGSRAAVISMQNAKSSTATGTDSDSQGGGTVMSVTGFNANAGGYAVAGIGSSSNGTSVVFSGLTEFADGAFGSENARYGMADDELPAGLSSATITATMGATSSRSALVVAAFR